MICEKGAIDRAAFLEISAADVKRSIWRFSKAMRARFKSIDSRVTNLLPSHSSFHAT
jgi:hypothetical protein